MCLPCGPSLSRVLPLCRVGPFHVYFHCAVWAPIHVYFHCAAWAPFHVYFYFKFRRGSGGCDLIVSS